MSKPKLAVSRYLRANWLNSELSQAYIYAQRTPSKVAELAEFVQAHADRLAALIPKKEEVKK